MKDLLRITFALLTLCGGGAFAQIDPGPDGIGVYFDTGATQVATTAVTGQWVEAYLIATHLSHEGGLVYWQSEVWPDLDEPILEIHGSPYDSFNFFMNMPGSLTVGFIALYDQDDPYPIQTIAPLAQLSIAVMDDTRPAWIWVRPSSYAVESTGGPYIDFYPSSGAWDLPVAVINGDAPIANRGATWGSVKSLYR